MSLLLNQNSTIVGIATTQQGQSAISIVRVSGSLARLIAREIAPQSNLQPRVMDLCRFYNAQKECIDQGLVVFFEAPHSFTGEDVVELHCHGNALIVQELLKACLQAGAILAQPGEFLYRGFWHDKYSLSQIEAISTLIHAQSRAALRYGISSLYREQKNWVTEIDDLLTTATSWLEGVIDFSDQDAITEDLFLEQAELTLKTWIDRVSKEIDLIAMRRIRIDGVNLCLIGPPNAGKSSFLNALAGEEISLIDDQPGTTRDLVRTNLEINQIPVRICDTAGLRLQPGSVELKGIEKAKNELKNSQVIVYMIPDLEPVDFALLPDWKSIPAYKILVRNKIDLSGGAAGLRATEYDFDFVCGVSTIESRGLTEWRDLFSKLLSTGALEETSGLNSLRQQTVLIDARKHVLNAINHIKSPEIAATELRYAKNQLQKIIGNCSQYQKTDMVLEQIFSQFCIGK